jgi:diguanylate cyclase (GGDEF)-like protein/PAS domain S-box-containing protein
VQASHVVAVVMAAATVITAGCAVVLWRRRTLVGARSLAIASAAVAWWSAFYTAEVLAGSPDLALVLGDVKYLGICLLPPAWLLFALEYTGRAHLVNGWLFAFLAKHPMIMALLLAGPATHDLVRGATVDYSAGGIPEASIGPLFWPHFSYVTAVLAIGAVLLLQTLAATSRRYLRPSLILSAAVLLPWVANLAFNAPGFGIMVDPTPAAFALVELAFLWGVVNFQLFNLAPIARSTVVDTLDDAVIVVDPGARTVDLNRAAETLLGVGRREAAGTPLSAFLPDHPDILAGETWPQRREVSLARGGTVVDFEVTVSPVRNRSATVPGHVLVMRDVTDRRRAERRMDHLVHHDQLTELPNRKLYTDRLDQALAWARRTKTEVGVLFVDLDGFKEVNDTFGHDIGDLILRQTAQRLLDCLRETDTAARLGGDEFMVVVPEISGVQGATAVAMKILGAIAEPYTVAGHRVNLSASVGIALAPPNPFDRTTLARLADTAMYEAKARGKHRYAVAQLAVEPGADDRGRELTIVRASDPPGRVVVEAPRSLRRSHF